MALLFSCQDSEQIANKGKEQATQDSRSINNDAWKAAELNLSLEEFYNMSDEVKKMRKASIMMGQYVSLDQQSRTYSVDISEDDAFKAGIDREQYRRIVSEMETLNNSLVDYPDMELLDLKQAYKEYKQRLDSLFFEWGHK